MFQSIAHRYSRSPAIEPLAKKRGEILITTNNPPHGQITTDVHIGSPQKTKILAPWYDFLKKVFRILYILSYICIYGSVILLVHCLVLQRLIYRAYSICVYFKTCYIQLLQWHQKLLGHLQNIFRKSQHDETGFSRHVI